MNERSSKNRISEMIRYMVTVVILLTIVFLAVSAYRAVTDMQNSNNDSRKELSYLANKVRAADAAGEVTVSSQKYGDTLVISDATDSGTYETRVYQSGGKLYEEYKKAGTAYNKKDASEITETDKFDVSEEDGVISIATDDGKTIVALRTEA